MALVLVLFGREMLGHTVSAAPLCLKHTHTDTKMHNIKFEYKVYISSCQFKNATYRTQACVDVSLDSLTFY